MPRRLPKYVQAFVDRRNNQPRHYFRRKGYPLTALPGLPYTPEFMSTYGNALASSEELIKKAKRERPARSVQPVAKVAPGSMAALIRDFKAARFPELGEVTRENYTRLLNRLERAAGPLPVAKITEADIQRLVDERAANHGIEAGNSVRRIFRLLMAFAKERGYRKDNPAADIRKKKAPKGKKKGWATLSEDDIAKYVTRWPLGTKQYLSLAMLVCLGQRRSDTVLIGPNNVVGGAYDPKDFTGRSIHLIQSKTGKELTIPLAPLLVEALTNLAAPADAPAFITTVNGQPYSRKSFGNVFSRWARMAGIKGQASPHTLRKAAARRLAEAGCTAHEIASITGHDSLAEVERYTKEVAQRLMAERAIAKLPETTG